MLASLCLSEEFHVFHNSLSPHMGNIYSCSKSHLSGTLLLQYVLDSPCSSLVTLLLVIFVHLLKLNPVSPGYIVTFLLYSEYLVKCNLYQK